MRTPIVIGSRGSRLALIQAELVAAQLRTAYPQIKVTIHKIVTEGDHKTDVRLHQMAGEGVFVKELEAAMLDGRIDIAVHSLKDMPIEIPQELCLLGVTQRNDPRDVLVARARSLAELASGSRIGTGSLRRAVQIASYRPDLEVCSLRGNVDTRLRKVSGGEIDGVILAAAALLRLGREEEITEYLPLEHFLPAVGQGTLVIEGRLGDNEIAELVSPINHLPTWQGITAERAFLSALGGGCRAPIAALGTVDSTSLKLQGMVADASGQKLLYASEEGDAMTPEKVGRRLAQKILEMGASEFITEVKSR